MKIEKNQSQGLVKLTGTISNYKVTRASASFVFTEGDRNKLGVIAIAAGIAGLSGQAVATASNAMSVEEDADYVEFNLDGSKVKGWVWRSPFKDGDAVEVAAELRDDRYEAAGILRPRDRVVSLYPHCSRGRASHVKNAVKWWFIGTTFLNAVVLSIALTTVSGADEIWPFLASGFHFVAVGFYVYFGLAALSLSRKWMPFARLAEKVFRTLGLPAPGNVDLVKSSKANRKPEDPGEFGTFYFRY